MDREEKFNDLVGHAMSHGVTNLTAESLARYIVYGIEPGSFLKAVLCNNLFEAYARADIWNTNIMKDIVSWIYNNAPAGCWGSREAFDAWKGL